MFAASAACNLITGVGSIAYTGTSAGTSTSTSSATAGGATADGGGPAMDGGGGAGGSPQTGDAGAVDAGPTVVPFPIDCHPNGVAIGVYGTSGDWLNQLGLICVEVTGGVLGTTPYQVGLVGSVTGSNAFSYTCPVSVTVQEVVVGLTFNSGDYVNQINVECQTPDAWAANGQVGGQSGFLGGSEVGPNQGTALQCAQGWEICGVAGSSDQFVDAFSSACCVQL